MLVNYLVTTFVLDGKRNRFAIASGQVESDHLIDTRDTYIFTYFHL